MPTQAELDEKRAAIEQAVAAARAKQEEDERQKAELKKKFGTHYGITCDGCNCAPVVGFRYKCNNCKNHDLCEACHDKFKAGTLPHVNKLNTVSTNVENHNFRVEADMGNGFKPMNKEVHEKKEKKVKPNEPCTCGSGKKYKKCCGDPANAK